MACAIKLFDYESGVLKVLVALLRIGVYKLSRLQGTVCSLIF